MRTMQKFAVLGCAILLAASCQKEQPLNQSDSSSPLKAGESAVIESVTGSGNLHREYFEPDVWRTFTFNAVKKADGSVTGTFQLKNHNLTSLGGKVICMTIHEGNKASFLVEWDKYSSSVTDLPELPYGYFVVEDNGEGKDTPDRISLYYLDDDLNDCGVLYELPMYDVEAGNVQIHKK